MLTVPLNVVLLFHTFIDKELLHWGNLKDLLHLGKTGEQKEHHKV